VIYSAHVDKTKSYQDPDTSEEWISLNEYSLLKTYLVWNIDQTAGIPEKALPDNHQNETCEGIIRNMPDKPAILSGESPCYIPSRDVIRIPDISLFKDSASYFAVLYHEAIHSTGHTKRLNRLDMNHHTFGSDQYSREELVAEIGASFLCNLTGIENKTTIENANAYLASWLKVLKNDKKMIVTAAASAQKAVDYIRGESHSGKESVSA
jgi:antirestriction protein ArdC